MLSYIQSYSLLPNINGYLSLNNKIIGYIIISNTRTRMNAIYQGYIILPLILKTSSKKKFVDPIKTKCTPIITIVPTDILSIKSKCNLSKNLHIPITPIIANKLISQYLSPYTIILVGFLKIKKTRTLTNEHIIPANKSYLCTTVVT